MANSVVGTWFGGTRNDHGRAEAARKVVPQVRGPFRPGHAQRGLSLDKQRVAQLENANIVRDKYVYFELELTDSISPWPIFSGLVQRFKPAQAPSEKERPPLARIYPSCRCAARILQTRCGTSHAPYAIWAYNRFAREQRPQSSARRIYCAWPVMSLSKDRCNSWSSRV